MKKLLALLVALSFAAGTVGFAAAQTTTPTTPGAEKKADDKAKKSGDKMDKMKAKIARGTVKTASADSIVVGGKEKDKAAEWTFAVDSKTSIKKGGKAVTAADLKVGDSVQVRYMDREGKAVAQSVTVTPPAKAKAANPCAGKNPCAAKK